MSNISGASGANRIVDLPAETPSETPAAPAVTPEPTVVRGSGAFPALSLEGGMLAANLNATLDAGATTPTTTPNAAAMTVPAEAKAGGKDDKWKLGVAFGPRLEKYEPVDVRIKNDRVDVTIKGVEFLQRNSMEYYKFWEAEKLGNVFQFIDEPTNQTIITAEKTDLVVGIKAYHPKTLISLGGDGKPNLNTNVHMQGTVEGKPVDANVNLADTFGAVRLTHKFMNFEAFAQKRFTVAEGKAGKLTAEVGGGIGVYTGMVNVSYRDPKDYWNFISYNEDKMKPVGGEISLNASVTYMLSGGRVGFGADANITRGKMKYDMMGGTTSHDVKSSSIGVFVKVTF